MLSRRLPTPSKTAAADVIMSNYYLISSMCDVQPIHLSFHSFVNAMILGKHFT